MLLGFNLRGSEEVVEEEGMIIEATKGKQTTTLDFTPAADLKIEDLKTNKGKFPIPLLSETPRDWINKPETKKLQIR